QDGEERPYHDIPTLITILHKSHRLTIHGENGSGKSTILLLAKGFLAEKALLIPTHQTLFFSEILRGSTGEKIKEILVFLHKRSEMEYLLLDEWDANLDVKNRAYLSSLIDDIAQKIPVIEVRHH